MTLLDDLDDGKRAWHRDRLFRFTVTHKRELWQLTIEEVPSANGA